MRLCKKLQGNDSKTPGGVPPIANAFKTPPVHRSDATSFGN
jgi:hypothetical protein